MFFLFDCEYFAFCVWLQDRLTVNTRWQNYIFITELKTKMQGLGCLFTFKSSPDCHRKPSLGATLCGWAEHCGLLVSSLLFPTLIHSANHRSIQTLSTGVQWLKAWLLTGLPCGSVESWINHLVTWRLKRLFRNVHLGGIKCLRLNLVGICWDWLYFLNGTVALGCKMREDNELMLTSPVWRES